MIATLRLERIGIVDPSYFFPFVGGREDGAPGVTTALERTLNLLESSLTDFHIGTQSLANPNSVL